MGIKKYSGEPGADGKFLSHRDAKYADSGIPSYLNNCIGWYKNDLLDKSDNVWANYIKDNVTWASDKTYTTGDYVYCPGIFKSLINSNTQSPFNPDAWEQISSVWEPDKTYATGDYCVFQFRCFKSQVDDNLGNQPPIAENHPGTYWEESSDAYWWNPGSYSVDNLVIMPAVWLCMDSAANYYQPQRGLPLAVMSTGAKTPWDSATEYNISDFAFYNSTAWRSLTDNNTGNVPTTGSSYWVEDTAGCIVLTDVWQACDTVWDSGTTYTDGDCVRYHTHIYEATSAADNLNQNPVNNPTYWEDKGIPENVWQLCDVYYWASGTTYSTNSNAYENLVWHNSSVYLSLQSSNTGNNPITADTYWDEVFTLPLPDARNAGYDYRCPAQSEYDYRPVADFAYSRQAEDGVKANIYIQGNPATYTITDYTVIVVFNPSERTQDYVIIRNFVDFKRLSNKLLLRSMNPESAFYCSTGITLTYNKPVVASLGWSSGNGAYARVNGVEISSQSGDLGTPSRTGSGGLNNAFGIVGGGSSEQTQAYTFDVLMFNRKLSSTEVAAVENFLMGKWNIAKLKAVTASGAGNSDGDGTYLESTMSAVTFANNVAAYDGEWNTMYTFDKYLQYNSEEDRWELWHDYTEDYGPLPSGAVEGPEMQYVVSSLLTYSSEYGNSHYLLYNETDAQWEFWMYNEFYGEESEMWQNLLTYVASGTSDTVPTSGWTNVSGISAYDTVPSITSNF